MSYSSCSPDNFGIPGSDQFYDIEVRLEGIFSDWATSTDTPYSHPYEEYSDCTRYTAKTLTDLEPYRPASACDSPPIYAKMNPVLCPGQLDASPDDAAVVPYGLSPDHEGTPSPVENMEEYNNLSAITPTVMDLKMEPVYEDLKSYSSSSPASSSTSTTSWLQSTQVADDSRNDVPVYNHVAAAPPSFSPPTVVMQCVRCGTNTCELGHWRQDRSGNALCNSCWRSSFYESMAPDITLKPKPVKKMTTRKANQMCSNCKTEKTSLWRRSNTGETVCNACGLYYKLHKAPRPLNMRKDAIQKRKRKPKSSPKAIMERSKFLENGVNHQAIASSASSSPPSYACHVSSINGLGGYYNSSPNHTLPPMDSPDGFSNHYSPLLLHHSSTMAPTSLPSDIMMAPAAATYAPLSTASTRPVLPSYESSLMSIAPSISPSSSHTPPCSLASLLQSPPSYRRFADSPY